MLSAPFVDINKLLCCNRCETDVINGCRYMLLPALLGYFLNKNTRLERFDAIQKSQVMNTLWIVSHQGTSCHRYMQIEHLLCQC